MIKRPAPSLLTIDATTLKAIKDLARLAAVNVVTVHELLQEPLTSNNSEIRLLAVILCNELFTRSKHFRIAMAETIKDFVHLTIGGKANGSELPPPTDAARVLREKSIAFFEDWHLEYGVHFQSLRVAYQYMSKALCIVFPKAAKEEAEYEFQKRKQAQYLQDWNRAKLHLKRVNAEIQGGALLEVEDHSIILENCLSMLVPGSSSSGGLSFNEYEQKHQTKKKCGGKLKIDYNLDKKVEENEEDEEDEWIDTSDMSPKEEVGSDDYDSDLDDYEGDSWSLYDNTSRKAMNALGITSEGFELKIHVSSIKAKILEQTSDHRQYIEPTLIDCIRLTDTRYMPLMNEWIKVHETYIKLMRNDYTDKNVRVAFETLQTLNSIRNQILQRTENAKKNIT